MKPSDVWIVGTELARTTKIPRTTLQHAVSSGAIKSSKLGSGQTVVVWRDVVAWVKERQR